MIHTYAAPQPHQLSLLIVLHDTHLRCSTTPPGRSSLLTVYKDTPTLLTTPPGHYLLSTRTPLPCSQHHQVITYCPQGHTPTLLTPPVHYLLSTSTHPCPAHTTRSSLLTVHTDPPLPCSQPHQAIITYCPQSLLTVYKAHPYPAHNPTRSSLLTVLHNTATCSDHYLLPSTISPCWLRSNL